MFYIRLLVNENSIDYMPLREINENEAKNIKLSMDDILCKLNLEIENNKISKLKAKEMKKIVEDKRKNEELKKKNEELKKKNKEMKIKIEILKSKKLL